MERGWEVELNDGTIYKEANCSWREIPKLQIKRLSLLFDGRRWDLTNKEAYFIRNSASVSPGGNDVRTEKRCIGYYEGKDKVHYIINEHTGEMKIKIE